MNFFRDDEHVVPVFFHPRLQTGAWGDGQLCGFAFEGQNESDLLVHVTVPHLITSRPQVEHDDQTGFWHLKEQELGRQIKYPIARVVFEWDAKTYPNGTEQTKAMTAELERRISASDRAAATARAELAAATPHKTIPTAPRSSVLHPGQPHSAPYGIKDTPEPAKPDRTAIYDAFKPFMLGERVKVKVLDASSAILLGYAGTLAFYVHGNDPTTGEVVRWTWKFFQMNGDGDFSCDMEGRSLEIELIQP